MNTNVPLILSSKGLLMGSTWAPSSPGETWVGEAPTLEHPALGPPGKTVGSWPVGRWQGRHGQHRVVYGHLAKCPQCQQLAWPLHLSLCLHKSCP